MFSRFRTAGLVVLVIVTLASLLLSLAIGARSIAPDDVLRYLFHPELGDPISQVVWQSRVPRTVLVVLAGASLGVAGGLMQTVTRNPLTDPGILGVNAGASLAVVAGLAFLGLTDLRNYMWFALAGAFITSIVVFIVGNTGKNRGNAVRMTLSGVAIGAVLSGFSSAILLTNSDVLRQMRGWAAGTTASQSLEDALSVVPLIAIGLVIAFLSTSLRRIGLRGGKCRCDGCTTEPNPVGGFGSHHVAGGRCYSSNRPHWLRGPACPTPRPHDGWAASGVDHCIFNVLGNPRCCRKRCAGTNPFSR